MRSLLFYLIALGFSGTVLAESITFGFSRQGVGYEAIDKPQLLNLLPSDTLFITSENGREFPIEVTRFSRSFHGNLIVSGTTFSSDAFVMVVNPEGGIRGSLQDDDDFYFLETQNGLSSIRLRDPAFSPRPFDDGIDQSQYDPDQRQIDMEQLQPDDAIGSVFQERIYPAYKSGKAILDVLLYYDSTLEDAGATLDYMVELANYILQLTEVNTEIRIVAAKPADIPSSMKNQDILEFLRTDIDIAEQRGFYGADLVHVVRATNADTVNSGNCGIAYYTVSNGLGKRGSINAGVTQWSDSYCYPETFAHEIGHNLGSAHNREQEGGANSAAAYPYSYGKLQPGTFGTVMAYRDPSEDLVIFSSPDFSCMGYPCGNSTASAGSADNRRSIANTRFIVAGYEGQQFYYESIQEYAYSESCFDNPFGTFEGINLRNSSRAPIAIRGVRFLRSDGSEYSSRNFEKGEYQVDPGNNFGWGWCDGPLGTDVREGFFIYENPVNGALVEGRHVFFDDNYSGGYANIKVAATPNGKVVGHPARTVRTDESALFTFTPNTGFQLSGVSGTCAGSVRGNTYTVRNAYRECTIVPKFKAVATSDDVFRVSLEEPVVGNTYTGIRNLRGWALASSGIEKLEVFIDGVYQYDIPHGGFRGDVANIFPEVEGSADSGFSMAFGYTNLSVGEHVAMVRATTSGGSVKESSSTFEVAKFHKPFIGSTDRVNLSGGTCQISGDRIYVAGALIDGQSYDLDLQWRTAAQDFEIIEIDSENSFAGFASNRLSSSLAQPGNSSDDVFRVSSDDVFQISLEEPVPDNTYTGIRNLRGWALATSGIQKIEVLVDGVYQFDIPHGGLRGDVGGAFPQVEGSSNSGFSMAYGYTNLSAGEHVVTVRATSNDGSVEESSSAFSVAKFHKPFIGASDTVDLSSGSCQMSGDVISVGNALIDGKRYDLKLKWRTAAQDFEIIEIN